VDVVIDVNFFEVILVCAWVGVMMGEWSVVLCE